MSAERQAIQAAINAMMATARQAKAPAVTLRARLAAAVTASVVGPSDDGALARRRESVQTYAPKSSNRRSVSSTDRKPLRAASPDGFQPPDCQGPHAYAASLGEEAQPQVALFIAVILTVLLALWLVQALSDWAIFSNIWRLVKRVDVVVEWGAHGWPPVPFRLTQINPSELEGAFFRSPSIIFFCPKCRCDC
jgi:hypothetical protein